MEAWASRFDEDLAQADRRLDSYLSQNALAGENKTPDDIPPDAGKAAHETRRALDRSDWVIRPALPADEPVLCGMFDKAFRDPDAHEILVIHRAGKDEILGAIALRLSHMQTLAVSLAAGVRPASEPPRADQDSDSVLHPLLRAGIARAAAGGAKCLKCTFSSEVGLLLEQCLQGLHFKVKLTETSYSLGTKRLRDVCMRVVEGYRRRGAIPEDIRVVRLDRVGLRKVDEFFRMFFADGIGPDPHELSQPHSRVVFRGDEIIASYVGVVKRDILEVPRFAAIEEFRGGWAIPLIIGDGAKACHEAGITGLVFYIDESRYPNFVEIADRDLDAKPTGTLRTMGLDLVVPWNEVPRPSAPMTGG